MDQRKLKIIDKKFQLHTTYSFMGIFFILIGIIIITIGINYYNDNKKIEKIIGEQNNIMNAQGEIINSMLQIIKIKDGNYSELNAKIKEKSDNNSLSMKNNIAFVKELTQRNNLIFLIIIVFLIATGFILYPVLIRKTHKISGPIYLMSEYMKEIIKGNFPDLRPLRKKDELKEFYELFSKLITFLQKREDDKI
jgi:nitrogen fixation/metabolism regulation signal transduction histidine kinase